MSKNKIQVAPSILSADFGHLADEAKRIADSGADSVHIDIMDGHFVPNLTLGVKAVAAINRATDRFLDVNTLIYNPYDYIERLVEAGADRITFHFEATEQVEETLRYIRKCNIEAGLAFCPETPVSLISPFLTQCDLILLMTVNPGFGGQAFISDVLEKVKTTRLMLNTRKIAKGGIANEENFEKAEPFLIQVDGGIDDKTAPLCIDSGANVLVSGSYLFNQPDLKAAIQVLKG